MIGRLHVLTDQVLQDRFDHVTLGRLALEGGADVIQYREKRAVPDLERLRVAEALAALCADHGGTLIIDDRPDLARVLGVGVHLGPRDLPVERVVDWVQGPVGGTANDRVRANDPVLRRADYLGVGPVFGTTSKGTSPPPRLGLVALREICASVHQPVIAIGGITAETVGQVVEAGAHGVAVLGAVCLADDPAAATARLREALP